MLIELGLIYALGNTVEVSEQASLSTRLARPGFFGLSQEIVDQGFGLDLFLYIQWRCVNDEIAPVLLILATP